MLKNIRTTAWVLVFLLAGYLGYSFSVDRTSRGNTTNVAGTVDIGGPFSIPSTDGEPLSDRDLLGRPWMLFFGFTYCPDVCPTTLAEMSNWLAKLGDKAKDMKAVFVTVDPERDTIEVLSDYISSFDKRIVALRPSSNELATMASNYKIYYKKVPNENGDDYTMDHSAAVFLFDRRGRFVSTVDYHEDPATAVKKLERLLTR